MLYLKLLWKAVLSNWTATHHVWLFTWLIVTRLDSTDLERFVITDSFIGQYCNWK